MNGGEKWVLAVVGVIGGLWSLAMDGLGLAVATLAMFMAIDYVSGLAQGFYNKNLNSEIGFRGLFRKVYFLLLVGACYMFRFLNGSKPSTKTPGTYKIQEGDTFWGIANNLGGITVEDLITANRKLAPKKLKIGKVINHKK